MLIRIIRQMIVALAKKLKDEIQFSSNKEMELFQCSGFQNNGFAECKCIVDGTEILIS
jgi:hypothetical protein